MAVTPPARIPFKDVLAALRDETTPFPARLLYRLSDLEGQELARLTEVWPTLPAWRRKGLMEDLRFLGESNLVLSFESVALLCGRDPLAEVRLPALHILKEYTTPANLSLLLRIFQEDPSAEVRGLAATLLGAYVYAGELEELSPSNLQRVVDALLDAFASERQTIVRQQILEALGYSSRDEVTPLIRDAFRGPQETWIASALTAMGHSGEDRWRDPVLMMLDHDSPAVRAAAVRTAGELALSEATPQLMELIEDPDDEVRLAVIWALSQIGGEGVQELLENQLDQAEDDKMRAVLQDALDNLSFSDELQDPLLLAFDPDDDLKEAAAVDEDDLLADLLEDELLDDERLDDELLDDERLDDDLRDDERLDD